VKHGQHLAFLQRSSASLLCAIALSCAPRIAAQQQHNNANDRQRSAHHDRGHAGEWLRKYGTLPPEQQQQALRKEPDFQKLPPERQQHLLDRLKQFNARTPDERQRMIARMEAIDRMSPQDRDRLENALERRRQLPPERRHIVNRAYNFLRELPPQEQERALNSPKFQQQFSEEERGVLRDLLTAPDVEPRLGDALAPR